MNTAIKTEAATKHFGDVLALDEMTIRIESGELVGLLGPNGSGKSTLMSLLSGQRQPSSGVVTILDRDPRLRATRTALGVTPQETGLPSYLAVNEAIRIIGLHYPERLSVAETVEMFGLADIAGKRIGSLSGGQRRKVAVAVAFVGKPAVVLLDEPSTGLDVNAREEIWNCIREQHRLGTTIMLTSHYLEEIEALAQRVLLIKEGRLLADQSLKSILDYSSRSTVGVTSSDARIAEIPSVISHHRVGSAWKLNVEDTTAFVTALAHSGYSYTDLRIEKGNLGDFFAAFSSEDRK